MKSRFISTNDGFTLTEVLVSLTIMAMVLVAVFRLHAQSISVETATRFHTTAAQLAQATLAEVQSTPVEALQSASGEYGDGFAGFRWQVTLTDLEAETLGPVSSRLKRISIDIFYGTDDDRHNLTTYHFFQ